MVRTRRRKADEIASSSRNDRRSANVRFCNFRVCCDVDAYSSWVSGTNPIIDGALAKAFAREQRNLRCRVASRLVSETVQTVSLPDLCSLRAYNLHMLLTKQHILKSSNLFFSQSVIRNKFVLDRIALSGEPSKQALGKDAPNGATQFANSF